MLLFRFKKILSVFQLFSNPSPIVLAFKCSITFCHVRSAKTESRSRKKHFLNPQSLKWTAAPFTLNRPFSSRHSSNKKIEFLKVEANFILRDINFF